MNTVTFQGNPLHLEGELPVVGQKAPDFVLAAKDLSPRGLKDYAGKVLVLVSVPSLDTPVCDMEVRRFNTEAAGLSDKVRIVAVSCDLPFAQARWCGAAGVKSDGNSFRLQGHELRKKLRRADQRIASGWPAPSSWWSLTGQSGSTANLCPK